MLRHARAAVIARSADIFPLADRNENEPAPALACSTIWKYGRPSKWKATPSGLLSSRSAWAQSIRGTWRFYFLRFWSSGRSCENRGAHFHDLLPALTPADETKTRPTRSDGAPVLTISDASWSILGNAAAAVEVPPIAVADAPLSGATVGRLDTAPAGHPHPLSRRSRRGCRRRSDGPRLRSRPSSTVHSRSHRSQWDVMDASPSGATVLVARMAPSRPQYGHIGF